MSILTLMGEIGGAVALLDRLTENPKSRKGLKMAAKNPAKKRKFSAAQLRAQKLFAERAKAGKLRKSAKKNAPKKARKPVSRVSQATGKKPTKRLVVRRKKTARAPVGFYANPIKRGYDVLANGARVATFATLHHAKEYGQAFADAHKTQVKLQRV